MSGLTDCGQSGPLYWSTAQAIARRQGHLLVDDGWVTMRDLDGRTYQLRRLHCFACGRSITALAPREATLDYGIDQPCKARPQPAYYLSDGREA